MPPHYLEHPGKDVSMSKVSSQGYIHLACTRCRKGKIRCSSDSGNELGCKSCIDAGTQHFCRFIKPGSDLLMPTPRLSRL
ncbi:hypothetical protein IWX90DRAFT_86665 [Phyllosticta citrichinensis]|uniref:Zn(2)-C6 fungal-type domain-containing protein n=1 Tax=Phyllosticta citrichinensis TaxID=1130410 RepID=A0ABR1XFD0_9PEZI